MLKPKTRNISMMKNESTSTEELNHRVCEAEISVDLTKNEFHTPSNEKRNITIEITDMTSPNTAEDIDDVISPTKDKENLIRLKIKMPKSPLNSQTKKERSFFTEKDFSTLPKEFIKFANSMISGDEIIKGQSFRSTGDARKRYSNKFLNQERCTSPPSNRFLTYKKSMRSDQKSTTLPTLGYDKSDYNSEDCPQEEEEAKLGDAISPILQENGLLSSTPKEDDVVPTKPLRPKMEPLYFTTQKIPEQGDDKVDNVALNNDNYVKIHENDGQNMKDQNSGLNDQILNKLRPYSKYKLQYLNNLHKLRNTPDDSFLLDIDQGVEATEFFDQDKLDESLLKNVVEKSSKYKPIMGKLALLGRFSKNHVDDSKIVKELVTEKFNPFFEKRQLSLKRNKKINNCETQDTATNDQSQEKELNQEIPRIIINDDAYSVVDKPKRQNDFDPIPIEEVPQNQPEKTETPNTEFEEFKLYQEVNYRATTSELWPSSKTNEMSSYSDYDAEKFLQTAIGDISIGSQTMIPKSYHHARRNSDDHSIQTAEMSLLISKASSISTFCSAVWRRVTRKNSPKKTQDADSQLDDSKLAEEQKNKRVTLLEQELAVQTEVIRQASKALDYCDNAADADVVMHIVEAERVILIATHKSNIIRSEIQDIQHYAKIKSSCSHLGTVVLKDLQFKMQEMHAKHEDSTLWFVCVLNRGTEVIASRPIQPKEDGGVFFKDEFTFEYLAPDFEISVSLFTLKVKKHKDIKRNAFQRMKFLSFRRDSKPPNQTLTSRFSRTSLRSPIKETTKNQPVRHSSFLLLGNTTLTIKDTTKTILPLTNIVNFANIKESFCATITATVNFDDRFASFLNVGTQSCRQVYWNRRWCVLDGTNLKYWTSPDDEDLQAPLRVINLTNCVRNVAPVDRSLCPRARTLLLEVLPQPSSNTEANHFTLQYFLTADTTEEMHNWEVALNSVINTLRGWNRLKSAQT